MNFHTRVSLPAAKRRYSHAHRFVSLGSCFADEIGKRLSRSLFGCATNPLGNLFNPLAVSEILIRATEGRDFREDEFFEHQELWRHFLVHSSLASTDRERSIQTANQAIKILGENLLSCDLLIITLGSAWVYQKKEYVGAIGHNHKLPLSSFSKRRLSPDEVSITLKRAIQLLRKENKKLEVCVTVSPVRHLRDGLHENNLSKASLLLAVDQMVETCPEILYFPAYELLLDELRDYRYFAEDLTHPSNSATEHIWSQFRESYFDDKTTELISELDQVLAMLNHRTLHTDTSQYAAFKAALQKRIHSLANEIPQAQSLQDAFQQLP
ncbi:GSCFA domain-containing protein [Pelagicoccus enzymogenes]|uniref:GSCFA domain-containing protein n=1 Tax=Pelagicoccus enzymogenes TaxID=2773457 RepID=UPI00280FD2C8|nr:GSCFA domain-containing protein [Pelagicoccus enzymogenes]MDQ8198506.1 GSCFA domain-containing protein [Pelagicoccus enzymogenes]